MIKPLLGFLLILAVSAQSSAQTDVWQDFGNYRVNYSVFNSSFIDPQVASTYGITRGDNIGLVNISLVRNDRPGQGLPANVSGRTQNLMMQTRELEFVEIDEGQATYYIASFRINNEDPTHFFINVSPAGSSATFELNFTRTLYTD